MSTRILVGNAIGIGDVMEDRAPAAGIRELEELAKMRDVKRCIDCREPLRGLPEDAIRCVKCRMIRKMLKLERAVRT